jgi:hypothetical protein
MELSVVIMQEILLITTTDSAYQDDVNVKGSPEHQSTPQIPARKLSYCTFLDDASVHS